MIKRHKYFYVFLFFINIATSVQTQSLDGVWRSNEMEYEEHLGIFELSSELIIGNGKYTRMTERISERAMYWSTGERGSIAIKDSEIVFFKEEQAYGQWDLHWEKEEEIIVYTFFRKDEILILIQNNTALVFKKVRE
jgi:hypothetical protein